MTGVNLVPHLTVLMVFGAARADATPEQLERLRNEALPAMRDHSVSYRDVVGLVFSIMGPRWAPDDEWLAQVQALGVLQGSL